MIQYYFIYILSSFIIDIFIRTQDISYTNFLPKNITIENITIDQENYFSLFSILNNSIIILFTLLLINKKWITKILILFVFIFGTIFICIAIYYISFISFYIFLIFIYNYLYNIWKNKIIYEKKEIIKNYD
jgi:hypothetical protein